MTHEEMFLQFCAAAGLKPHVSTIPILSREVRQREYTFEAKEMPKVEGYTGFVADFRFNADGSFVYLSIGE